MNTSVLRLRIVGLVGLFVCAVAGIMNWPGVARATPAEDFLSFTLSLAFFEDIEARTHVDAHKVDISTKGPPTSMCCKTRLLREDTPDGTVTQAPASCR